jgi:hypothetical protein
MSNTKSLQTLVLLTLLVVAFLTVELSRATYAVDKSYHRHLPSVAALTPSQIELNQLLQRAMWDVPVVGNYDHFVYKSGPAESTNCHNPDGFSTVQNIQAFDALHAEFIKSGGHQVLCVRAGDTAQIDETWQSLHFASNLVARLNLEAQVSVRAEGDAYRVELNRPASELAGYQYKFGAPDQTDCDHSNGYRPLRSEAVMVRKAETPVTVCVIPLDMVPHGASPIAYHLE